MSLVADSEEKLIYKDLKSFLLSSRRDVRLAATEAVLQIRDPDDAAKFVQHGLIRSLAKNCSDSDDQVSCNALKALLSFSSDGTCSNQCLEDLINSGSVNRFTEIALSTAKGSTQKIWRERVNCALSLLANMTRKERGAVEFVGKSLPDEAVRSRKNDKKPLLKDDVRLPARPTMKLLLARFLNPQFPSVPSDSNSELQERDVVQQDADSRDPYQHFAALLMNSTQIEAGRLFILKLHRAHKDDGGKALLQDLLPQLRSHNPLRRRGVAGTIRNCCLEEDFTWWLVNVVRIIKHLLYPLAGPEDLDLEEKQGLDPDLWLEGPDKKRETDHWTRLFLVESILNLCSAGRNIRESLRSEKVCTILKWADMVEEHEDVSESINECMQYLRRDEVADNECSDKVVRDSYQPLFASAARTLGSGRSYDDVD